MTQEIHQVKNVTEEIREYYKNKIVSALQSNSSLSDSCKLAMKSLATEIETAIFSLFKETNSKYRTQVIKFSDQFNALVHNLNQYNRIVINSDESKPTTYRTIFLVNYL